MLSLFMLVLLMTVVSGQASASIPLKAKTRHQILKSVRLEAPNGKRIRKVQCVAGRLSTVNRRWASLYLSNIPGCVRKYGGASGEGVLLKRRSPHSRRWRRVGFVSDNCSLGEGGASIAVLRDLGCGVFY